MPIERYYEEDRLIENIREPYPLSIGKRTPLSVSHPHIAIEWHRYKNDGYGPEDFSFSSGVKVWWQCLVNKTHDWQTDIGNRTSPQASGCPHCYFESYGLDLANYPQVLKFFDKKKNRGISANKIPIGRKIHWHCAKGRKHDWHSRFNINVVDAFCPFCRGRKASPDNNLKVDPVLSKQFHPTKNGKRDPKKIVPTSKLTLWWKCPEGDDHEFEMRPYDRTIKGNGCPYCSRQRFSKTHSLAVEFPAIAKQFHKTKNGDLKANGISSRSKRSVWWKCPKGDDHEWEATIMDRTYRGYNCRFCSNRALSQTNSLASLFPDVAKEFDKKKNHPLTARDVVATSTDVVFWKCANNHSWEREVYLRTKRGSRCPDCPDYGKARVITSLKEAFPKIIKYWHPKNNGDQTPENTSFGSKLMAWWKCPKGSDHEWQQGVGHMTRQGYKCPYCEGFRLSVTNNLKTLYPALAREWHPRLNELKASEVLPGSAYKPYWRCGNCKHEWDRECYLRTNRQSACPACKSYPTGK